MIDKLKQENYLDSIKAMLVVKYSTHGVCVPIGQEEDEPFHSYDVDIFLYKESREEIKIGEARLMKFNYSKYKNVYYTEMLCDMAVYEYYLRLVTRMFGMHNKKWLIIDSNEFDITTFWCIDSMAILPEYRGLGLGEMILENIKKVLMIPKNNFIFGFTYPFQYFNAKFDSPEFYAAKKRMSFQESHLKLKKFYKGCGFQFLEDFTENETTVGAALNDKKQGSHLFFQLY